MAYEMTDVHLRTMFEQSNFTIPNDELVFIGLRGTSPVNIGGTGFAGSHHVHDKGTDYLHMRCSLIQWRPAGNEFAIFPGSTVPYITSVRNRISAGGAGVNQLSTCFLRRLGGQDHRYLKGDHGNSSPLGPHRAFQNLSKLPIWRTGDDADYEGDDQLQFFQAFDNLHCGRQANVTLPHYSSLGCQVVAGTAGRRSSNPGGEGGAWKKFIDNAYAIPQRAFHYALFEEGEAQRTAVLGPRPPSVRFGSSGP